MDLEYRYSESTVKPESVEIGKTTIFIRTDIKKETRTDTFGDEIAIWTYKEAKMSPDDFTTYASLLSSKDVVNSVNANNQLSIMDAIADLYEMILGIKTGGDTDGSDIL